MFIVLEFLSDKRQRVHLDGKASASVAVVSRVPQGSVLGPLLFILYNSELFHIVEKHIVTCADDTANYAVILRQLSRSQVMDLVAMNSLYTSGFLDSFRVHNQDLAAVDSRCLKWHMRLKRKKPKSMVVSRSRINALGHDDLVVDGAQLEEVKNLRTLMGTLDFKLTFETHLREVASKAARSLDVVR